MTGPAAAGVDGLRHAARRYRTAAEMADSMLEFAAAGLTGGEAVLVSSAGPVLRQLREQLGSDAGLVTWTGLASASTNPGRITSALRAFADEHRGQRVRCIQEPAWHLLPPAHLCEAIRHEALVNLVLAGCEATVLCGYDAQLGEAAAASARRTHPLLVQDGRWQPSGLFTADNVVPAECNQPLPPPPASAVALTYRADQAAARQFAAEQARLAGLAPARVTDLVIAVGELASNTLAHTSGPGTLWLWAHGGELLCQVHDGGHIADPLAGSCLPGPAELGGGRGLWVVHQVCDLVELRTGGAGTTVRLHLRLGSGQGGDDPAGATAAD